MNILDLVAEMGLEPERTSSSRGGEYHCPCPRCGGDDRFMCWPEEDRYWCRQCKARGDAIQFCRDFQHMSFREAYIKVKGSGPDMKNRLQPVPKVSRPIRVPSCSWIEKAGSFAEEGHKRLLIDPSAMEQLFQRGLTIDTIRQNQLGWNPVKAFRRLSDWGLEETEARKWLCLPIGIVIPLFEGSAISKLKIRKSEWDKADLYGKYYEAPGSSNALPLFGDPAIEATVIVESEFDAMLVIQEAGDLCNCVSLGGASKNPHQGLREWLLKRRIILFALDFDEAGKREFVHWRSLYPNLEPWPIPEEKSPGDYFAKSGCIKRWISSGLKISTPT